MTENIWDATISISEGLVRTLIQDQTSIDVKQLSLIGEGYDNFAYLINGQLLFRFPRREAGIHCMENEIALLPYIAQHITFPIIAPQFIGKATKAYPYQFAGYPIIKGRVLNKAMKPLVDNLNFARIIGKWLKELHSIPVNPVHAKLARRDADKLRIQTLAPSAAGLTKHINKYAQYYRACGLDQDMLLGLIRDFSHLEFQPGNDCYVHEDLYPSHIIVDEQCMPAGIIDWGHVHVGHPGIDLPIGMIFTERAFEAFLAGYGYISDEIMKVAVFRSLCLSIEHLPYCCQKDEPGSKEWAVSVLIQEIRKFQQYS